MRFLVALVFTITAALSLSACITAGETRLGALDRFARETGCHPDRARTQSLGSGDYRVGGCGQRRTYHCRLARGMEFFENEGDSTVCYRTE